MEQSEQVSGDIKRELVKIQENTQRKWKRRMEGGGRTCNAKISAAAKTSVLYIYRDVSI